MSEQQTKETKKPFIKNSKVISTICIVALIAILLAVLKYKALLPIVVLLVVVVAIAVNRSILRKRKGKNTQEVSQCDLTDSDRKKFAGYFVSQDEQYISSLGNGYIMNFLANGTLKRGFAVISNKRVYFRGSCYSGQGKSLVKTNEERTVDIKDVTGSGFIYRRYLGVLIGLFTALAVLLAGIAGSLYGVTYEWNEISYYQNSASVTQERIKEANNAGKNISDVEEQIEANQKNIDELQDQLNEEMEKLQYMETAVSAIPEDVYKLFFSDTSGGSVTGLNQIYADYLNEVYDIYNHSELADMMNKLYQDAKNAYNINASYLLNDIINEMEFDLEFHKVGNFDERIYILYHFDKFDKDEEFIPRSSQWLCPFSQNLIAFAFDLYDSCEKFNMTPEVTLSNFNDDFIPIEITYDYDLDRLSLSRVQFDEKYKARLAESVSEEEAASYQNAYKTFLEKISPELAEAGHATYGELITQYVKYHLDEFKEWFDVPPAIANVEIDYNFDMETTKGEIEQLKQANALLAEELHRLKNLHDDLPMEERHYEEDMKNASSSFMLATVATAIAGLLITFFISCFLVFLDYLKKRKTMFQIQYAGGFIAFDVSYYAKAEIEDFQKQLRRTKDYVEEVKTTVNVAPAPAPVWTETPQPTQNSTPDELRKYADLLKEGLISQEDYDAMKKKLLGL